MTSNTKEFYDLMAEFERIYKGERMDREPKELWKIGQYYQSGETNKLFKAFQQGYSLAKFNYQD